MYCKWWVSSTHAECNDPPKWIVHAFSRWYLNLSWWVVNHDSDHIRPVSLTFLLQRSTGKRHVSMVYFCINRSFFQGQAKNSSRSIWCCPLTSQHGTSFLLCPILTMWNAIGPRIFKHVFRSIPDLRQSVPERMKTDGFLSAKND